MNTKTKVILAFVTLFTMGFISGYLTHSSLYAPSSAYIEGESDQVESVGQRQRGPASERGGRRVERMRNRMVNMLDLSSEQQDPFFEYLSDYRNSIRSDVRDIRTREREVILQHYSDLRADLSGVLNPSQLEQLDSHLHPDSVRTLRMRGAGQRRGN